MVREMKDSGIEWIGEIPAEWPLERLKRILAERKEKNDPVKTDFILSLGAAYGVIPYSEKEGGGNKAKESLTEYRLAYPNDIVMNSMNIISGSVGISNFFGCVSPVYYMLYPHDSNNSSEYYCYIFQTQAFQRSLLGLGNGIMIKESSTGNFNTVRMRIPMEKLGIELLPLPSSEEQHLIASFLNKECSYIDSVIEQTRASIEEYKKLKQAVITQAVTKGIRSDRPVKDSGVDWLGIVPESWSILRIANLYDERNESGSDDLPILTVSINTGISDHEIPDEEKARVVVRSEDKSKYKRVYPGDLAYNMMRAWQGAFGAVRTDGMISPAYVVAKPKVNTELDSRYIEALLRTPSAIEEMHRYSHGITDFRLRLYWPEFKNIRVCVPPIEEQQEIADYIDIKSSQIDDLIAKKEKAVEELDSYKKSLIYEYVTGKKEVPA